ncbi:MAG: hypothetical protein WC058_06090 [Phycisphaeraceae bacterium]
MKRTDTHVSKAPRDVWAWKDAIYHEVRHLPTGKALSAILDRAQHTPSNAQPADRRPRRRKSAGV